MAAPSQIHIAFETGNESAMQGRYNPSRATPLSSITFATFDAPLPNTYHDPAENEGSARSAQNRSTRLSLKNDDGDDGSTMKYRYSSSTDTSPGDNGRPIGIYHPYGGYCFSEEGVAKDAPLARSLHFGVVSIHNNRFFGSRRKLVD